jgi:hypothetical protein
MDTPNNIHFPGRASHGAKLRRYIIRDLVGTEGSDWAADLPSAPPAFPVTVSLFDGSGDGPPMKWPQRSGPLLPPTRSR